MWEEMSVSAKALIFACGGTESVYLEHSDQGLGKSSLKGECDQGSGES